MANFRPWTGELVEASLRPMSSEETKAAEGWPELRLEPASWIEGDQVWVLELQPYDHPEVGGDLEEMQRPASDEKVEYRSPSGQSRHSPVIESGVPECQSLSDEAPLQKQTYISDGEAFSQSLKSTTEQSSHTKNTHICDQYGKDFQSPSDLTQYYQSTQSMQEPSQTAHYSQSALTPISLPLQTENMFVDSCETLSPMQMQTTEQSTPTKNLHICDHCGKGFQWLSELIQHQLVHSGGETATLSQCQSEKPSPNPLATAPLQEKENLLANSSAILCQKSTPVTVQRTQTKNVHLCDQCGKVYRWPSDVARHQRTHHGSKTTKQRKNQSEAGPLVPIPLPLREENMFVSSASAFSPKTKLARDQNTRTKKQHICDECGKACRKPYDLAQHYRHHHPGRKVAKQAEHQSEEGPLVPDPLPLQEENTFVSPASVFRPKLKLTTDRNTCTKDLHICDQCGKGYRWRSDLARHQRTHHGRKTAHQRKQQSEVGPLVPLPLQEENIFVSPQSAFRPNVKQMTDQNTRINNLHICDLCGMGYQWPSHLARHRCVHHGIKADKRRGWQSKRSPLVSVTLPLQAEKTFVAPDQSTHTKSQHICHLCGKSCRWPSDLARHQRACYRRKAAEQRECQLKASPLDSVTLPLQAEKTSVAPKSAFRPKSKLTSDQSTRTCHRCGKDCRWPSKLAQHQRFCRRKAAKQRKWQSKASPLVSVTLPLQAKKTFVAPDQSTHTKRHQICHLCGKGFRFPSALARHQRFCYRRKAAEQRKCQSKASPLVSVTLPLQAEKTPVATKSAFTLKSKLTSDQSTCTKNLHICDQCGKGCRWPSDLARHQRRHGRKTDKQKVLQAEASPLVFATVPPQEEKMFVSPVPMVRPKSMLMRNQSMCTKNEHTCDQCGKGCCQPCELACYQCHHSGKKATRQGQWESNSNSALAPVSLHLQTENTLADSCETVSQDSKLMTDQSTCVKNLPTCGQCGKGFQSPSELLHCNQYIHSGEKAAVQNLHRCEHYGKSFQCPSGLGPYLFAHSGEQATIQRPCQSEAHSPSPLASVPLQANISGEAANIFSPKSMLMADQSTHAMNPHICDQYWKGFWWPSEPAQHPCVHSGGKVARWGQVCSKGCSLSHLVSCPLKEKEDTAANLCKTFNPNSTLVSDQSTHLHISGQCGNACRRPPALDRRQHVHCGDEVAQRGHCQSAACSPSPIMPISLPLQQENTFTNSKQMRDQSIKTQNLQICSHSGDCFQRSSELTQYPWGGVARGDQCQTKVDEPSPSVSVTTSLQADRTFANCREAISLLQMTDQSAHSEKPSCCNQCGEGFQWPSDLSQHVHTHSREYPYSCASCGSRFRRKVQLVKHQKLHEETRDSDREEEDQRHHDGCGGVPREDIPTEQPQWLPPQGTEELCEPSASTKACEHGVCPTGARNSPEPLPPNSMWEIGTSGHPYIMSLGHSCVCGNCGTCDCSTIDTQPTKPSSRGSDDAARSDLTSPVNFCGTSTPIVLTASWGADENVEDVLSGSR